MKPFSSAVLLCLALSCANATPAPDDRPALNTTTRLQSPVKVSWEEVSRADGQAVVLAKIERITKLDLPFLVQVEVPADVTVKEGRQRLELLPNHEAVLVTERFVFTYADAPKEDARLRVDGNTDSMGFHFDVPYRFGRAAPEEIDPPATGPSLELGGRKLGPSVPLK